MPSSSQPGVLGVWPGSFSVVPSVSPAGAGGIHPPENMVGSINRGTSKWMVSDGKSQTKMDDLGGSPILGNLHMDKPWNQRTSGWPQALLHSA